MPQKRSQSGSTKSSLECVSIDKIRMDGGTQPRAQLYEGVVTEYAEDMRNGFEFPPVTLYYDGDQYWLADGFHRVRAQELNGAKDVIAQVHLGTQRDAVLYAVGANAVHGLRRTNADKRRAVEKLLRDDEWNRWSDREIARRCGVGNKFVGDVRRDLCVSETHMGLPNINPTVRFAERGGTVYEIDTKNIREGHRDQAKRKRSTKRVARLQPFVDLPESVEAGDIWKLGKSHHLFCGNPSSLNFQKLLPSEIGLSLIFLQTAEQWPQEAPANSNNVLLFYTTFGEDIDLTNLRQIVENCLSTTTNADDPVVVVNLPDPLLFIMMEHLFCPCYCAEPNPQRCTDALAAWTAIKQPVRKL